MSRSGRYKEAKNEVDKLLNRGKISDEKRKQLRKKRKKKNKTKNK